MYNRMYKFFSDNNLIYSLQFGFRQKYSTVHVLISLTENIRNLDEGNIGCGCHRLPIGRNTTNTVKRVIVKFVNRKHSEAMLQ